MRTVTSPTRSRALRRLATTVAVVLACAMLTGPLASSATAATTPQAPGSFTGYGFDACQAPSQKVMDAWNLRSPFSAIGVYISGSSRYCGDKYQTNLTKAWVAKNAANGWRFIPIHVGYQSPCFVNNKKSRVQKKHMSTTVSTARKQAASDAAEALAALSKYGFPKKSVMYLDLEWYSRTTACDKVVDNFVDVWTEKLHAAGYLSGVYSSGSAAIAALDHARATKMAGITLPDQLWMAWTNKKADTKGGPYLADAGWKSHQRLHQYENGVNVTYGGYTINIDKDFLDVGKGSRATTEPKPCSVPMTFPKYSTLRMGGSGPEISALQCLLKQHGLKKSINGTFGTGTRSGVDKFRASLGWDASGTVTHATWTALLSAGSRPHVLKRGSTGEAVWRLQRSLRAAGQKVTVNGLFDATTAAAVKKYRASHQLTDYQTVESSVWSLLQRGKTG